MDGRKGTAMFGWCGRLLRVDLTEYRVSVEDYPEALRHSFLGGRGVNSRLLYNEVRPGIDSLGPDNKIFYGTSPLTGTGLVTSGRIHVTAKSPLTGILGDSNAGGHFGPELKWAGYDVVIVEGAAERPVYLWVDDDHVEIRDASHIWGKVVSETYSSVRREVGDPRVRIAAIGPAGENRVRYASVMTDYGNACGKTGMGTVMGSKKLKAIVARGTRGFSPARPEEFKRLAKDLLLKITSAPAYKKFSRYGTLMYLAQYDRQGRSVARNAQQTGGIDYIDNYHPRNLGTHMTRNAACFGCPIHCKHEFRIEKGPFAGERGHGTEFCIMSAHGPSCGNADEAAMLKINNICNEYGICGDTSGITLAAAFEWYQRGIIDEKDTEGIALEWGNTEAHIRMLMNIIHRRGFGDVLAEGSVIAARKIGKGAEACISHAKGCDIDQVDIRTLKGCALSDAVSSRGADPQRGWPSVEFYEMKPEKAKQLFGNEHAADPLSYEGKGPLVNYYSSVCTLCDTLGLCKFSSAWFGNPIDIKEMAELVTAVTGVVYDERALWDVAARITNVERAFLVREGITRRDDIIQGRAMNEPVPSGPFRGERLDMDKFSTMLDEYYAIVGWDRETGIPLRATLERLGLEDVADELKAEGPRP
jgi:aldehyde:ferredoxin oxidoreductase